MDDLVKFVYFHDWEIDGFSTHDGSRLALNMHFDDKRATVTFVDVSRCVVEHFGLVNIVYEIRVLAPEDTRYALAQSSLAGSELYSNNPGSYVATVAATAGAEIFVEFGSLEIETA